MDWSKDSMLCVILSTISHLTLSPLRGTKSLSTSETCTKCSSPRSSLRKPWPRDRQKYVTVPACTSPCAHGGVLLSTLNSLCAVMDTFLRDNGLIRILLLHLPNLLGSLLTYATLQRYSLQYFTAAHNHLVCVSVTQTTNTQRCVVSGCVSTIKHIFSPIVLSIPNSGTRIYVYFFQFLAATRNFVAKVFSGNV